MNLDPDRKPSSTGFPITSHWMSIGQASALGHSLMSTRPCCYYLFCINVAIWM